MTGSLHQQSCSYTKKMQIGLTNPVCKLVSSVQAYRESRPHPRKQEAYLGWPASGGPAQIRFNFARRRRVESDDYAVAPAILHLL